MEVGAEAKRVMVVALGKLYSSRTQRGGLPLHRSLLLTLVMKSARDIYHAAHVAADADAEEPRDARQQAATCPHLPGQAEDNKENTCPSGSTQQHTRKRRGKATAEPDFLPCKKAKLEYGHCSQQLLPGSGLDFVGCSSELGPSPGPVPLQAAIAAC